MMSWFCGIEDGDNNDVSGVVAGIDACPLLLAKGKRATNDLNPCVSKKTFSVGENNSVGIKSSTGTVTGTSFISVTNRFEILASSAFVSKASRRLGCLISLVRDKRLSRLPYSEINYAAVLIPIPGTPGTLSTESPHKD